MERLQKFMARHGIASRRACEEIITSGRVKVNGKQVTELGMVIDPARDKVEVDGRILKRAEQARYILIYKPRGYISSVSDPQGRKKVTDLIPDIKERLYPVGRLDYSSEGLMLLTNDGELAYQLTHPSYNMSKTYRVRVKGIPSNREIEQLSKGIYLDNYLTKPATFRFIDIREGNALFEITIHEGRNRQIRRMFEKIGYEVIRLKRIKIGDLSLGNLKAGEYRHLLPSEIMRLKKPSTKDL